MKAVEEVPFQKSALTFAMQGRQVQIPRRQGQYVGWWPLTVKRVD